MAENKITKKSWGGARMGAGRKSTSVHTHPGPLSRYTMCLPDTTIRRIRALQDAGYDVRYNIEVLVDEAAELFGIE